MNRFRVCTSVVVPLPVNNIDTDQIIPARFLKATTRAGLGKHLFADWRYDDSGNLDTSFVLNRPEYAGAAILLAGDNFGCGSSREHAPWALTDYGFRVIISTSFADIFRGNALKNGLLPVPVTAEGYTAIRTLVEHNPGANITVDLDHQAVRLPDKNAIPFSIDSFARTCLLNGVDELGYLLSFEKEISTFEQDR